jgi:hypothetical protein
MRLAHGFAGRIAAESLSPPGREEGRVSLNIRLSASYFLRVLDSLPRRHRYVNVNNIHTEGRTSMNLVATLDEYGKPAWITATIVGFVLWWPIGLGVLAYLIWSGRMGSGNRPTAWRQYFATEARRFGGGVGTFGSTGNRAFDDYREATLRRLEEEATERGRGISVPRPSV